MGMLIVDASSYTWLSCLSANNNNNNNNRLMLENHCACSPLQNLILLLIRERVRTMIAVPQDHLQQLCPLPPSKTQKGEEEEEEEEEERENDDSLNKHLCWMCKRSHLLFSGERIGVASGSHLKLTHRKPVEQL